VNRSAKYVTVIVVAHLLINVAHGLAHRELHVGLAPLDEAFVILVILLAPLLAMALAWTARRRLGLILLFFSMFGSFLFGLYHHFLAMGPDHVRSQPASFGGVAFVLTAYGLLLTEAAGVYIGAHFLWVAKAALSKGAESGLHGAK
jgi:hypothetical protein